MNTHQQQHQGEQTNTDVSETLTFMRWVLSKNPNFTKEELIAAALRDNDELRILEQRRFCVQRLADRIHLVTFIAAVEQRIDNKRKHETKRERIIEKARIKLWSMQVLTVGKQLSACTFGELEGVGGKYRIFFEKLKASGAPGTLVREVFKSEKDLQDFWEKHCVRPN